MDFVDDHLSGVTSALSDRYTIESELGRGGMAIVYRAQDVKHHRDVAIKVLRPEFTASIGVDRFLREVDIAAKLTHPHVLSLFDSGKANVRAGTTGTDSLIPGLKAGLGQRVRASCPEGRTG